MINSLSEVIQKHIAAQFEDIMVAKVDETISELKKHLNEEITKAIGDIVLFEIETKKQIKQKAQDLTVDLLRKQNANGISVEVKI